MRYYELNTETVIVDLRFSFGLKIILRRNVIYYLSLFPLFFDFFFNPIKIADYEVFLKACSRVLVEGTSDIAKESAWQVLREAKIRPPTFLLFCTE